jgi:hypothetical protein
MSALIDAVAKWSLVARNGDRVTFARKDPSKKLGIKYAGETASAGPFSLKREGDGWLCDCPVERRCLHGELATRGLTDAVDEQVASDAPDPRFVLGAELVASGGLANAAAVSKASVEKVDDDSVRVGDATIVLGMKCDCPMGDQPLCLHRLIVDSWARGLRVAPIAGAASTGAAPGFARAATVPAAGIVERKPVGEKLPPQDVERFAEILDRADLMAAEILTFGLQRTGGSLFERLDALIIAAQTIGVRDGAPRNAGLGRLVRALEALRDELKQFQARIVTVSENDVISKLAVVRNIGRAIRANTGKLPLADYAGATQQEYETAPVLDVQGVGLEAWHGSDYAGITAYVADLRTGRILTRTNALPVEQLPGNWVDSLGAGTAFAGATVSYTKLSRGRYLLSGAQVSDMGRLSGSAKTQLAEREALKLDDPKLRAATLSGVGDAVRLARRLAYDPLGRPAPSPPVALVDVESLSPPMFDRQTQELAFAVHAVGGVSLVARATYSAAAEQYIENLEKLAKLPVPPKKLLCRLSLGGGLSVFPITAHLDGSKPQHLTYARLDA